MFGLLNKKMIGEKKKSRSTYMSVANLSDYFKITSKELNKIFLELKWSKQTDNGWIPTTLGKSKAAVGKYNNKSNQKYIMWNENIKNNFELIKYIKHFKEINQSQIVSDEQKKAKSDLYEEFIYNKYKQMNYIVASHGKDNSKKDCAIDLIAIKDKEIFFIQCKNWDANSNSKITDEHIKKTRKKVLDFLEDNPMFDSNNYKKKTLYITSECVLHWSAKHYLSKHEDVEHLIIPISQ
ncbi:hypothetical protein [Sulfurimonas sp.]|uniref:hypothetical protein n=1 Tax=Sulfurimonas sp. TaxID=2022749 RepID=UPI0035649CAA